MRGEPEGASSREVGIDSPEWRTMIVNYLEQREGKTDIGGRQGPNTPARAQSYSRNPGPSPRTPRTTCGR